MVSSEEIPSKTQEEVGNANRSNAYSFQRQKSKVYIIFINKSNDSRRNFASRKRLFLFSPVSNSVQSVSSSQSVNNCANRICDEILRLPIKTCCDIYSDQLSEIFYKRKYFCFLDSTASLFHLSLHCRSSCLDQIHVNIERFTQITEKQTSCRSYDKTKNWSNFIQDSLKDSSSHSHWDNYRNVWTFAIQLDPTKNSLFVLIWKPGLPIVPYFGIQYPHFTILYLRKFCIPLRFIESILR